MFTQYLVEVVGVVEGQVPAQCELAVGGARRAQVHARHLGLQELRKKVWGNRG